MKRFLAMLLTLCMLISMMSAFSVAPIVFAAGADGGITVAPLTSGSTYAGEAWYMNGKLSAFPRTIETEIKVSSEQAANNGVILGNYAYDSRQPYFIFRVLANGNLKVHYRDTANSTEIDFIFTDVNVISDKFVKVARVWDDLTGFVHCYVDGVLKQSIDKNTDTEITMQKMDSAICGIPFAVGSDRRTMGEGCFFKGEIRNVALYSDTRSATEIAADAAGTAVDANDENLLVAYNTTGDKQGKNIEDLSKNNIDLMYQKFQMSESEMTALCGTRGDYDYSIAIVGDMHTQQNAIDSLDWIAARVKDRNIKYVLQTGDLTDKDTPAEWTKMLTGFKDLDGVVPYSVNIGNHDYYCGLGKYQINGGYNVNQYFGAHKPYTDLIDNYGGYFKKGDVANTYRTLDVNENIKYLFLNLEYTMSLDVVEWANKVIAEHPDHKVIITSHSYLYSNSNLTNNSIGHAPSRDNPDAVDGYQLWDMLVRKHKNIIMYVSGHELSDDVIMSQVKGDNGNTITQLLVNPQQVNSRMKAK